MLKKTLFGFAALLISAAPALAVSSQPLLKTYVSTVRVTLPVVATSSAIYAFQNTDAAVDVVIRKIEISNASTMTVTGGTMQFWVYGSTQMTHSAAVTSNYGYGAALTTQPSFVSVSSAPYNIQVEGDAAVITGGSLSGTPALIRPLYVNNDEAAVTLLTDSWSDEDPNGENAGLITLNHGANRGIAIVQKRLGTTDISAGSVLVRVFYNVR